MLAVLALGAACGQWQRVGSSERPEPGTAMPRLFDAAAVYRSMGFLVAGPPLPFVGSVRYLAGPTDSTLALVAVSLANNALSFHRDAGEFVANYRVEVTFSSERGTVRHVARDEAVRVRTFQETLRADESVIYQQFVMIPPGRYTLAVFLRDRNGPASTRQEQPVTVPAFGPGSLSWPLPYYEGSGRQRVSELPRLLVNPKATLAYGADSLRAYVEAYGVAPGARLTARVVDGAGTELWRDSTPLVGDSGLSRATVTLATHRLPLGQAELEATLPGGATRGEAPLLVSFSHQWVITNFQEVIGLLRYFERQDWIGRLRDAPDSARPALWREFWQTSDPVPVTPQHEALDEYFRRVQLANQRFGEGGDPGWLTDRGEVFITLGEPDEVLEIGTDLGRGSRAVKWTYMAHRLILFFRDETGFGRFRLTPLSRAEYQRVLVRVRRPQ